MGNYLQLYWKQQEEGTSYPQERLGQWFANRFITYAWPELYYAQYDEAVMLIDEWMEQHHYFDTIPPYTNNWKERQK